MDAPASMPESNETECVQQERLFAEVKQALGNLVKVQSLQMAALALGNRKVSRFNQEIRVALRAWQHARHAYLQHVLDHGCRSSSDLI